MHGQTAEYQYDSDWAAPVCEFTPELYRWLVVPDVALQKGRLARRYFAERSVYIDSYNGYGFCASEPVGTMGKTLEINTLEPFDPKALKRRLKGEGIKNIDILHRNFPLSTAEIARQIGVSERGKNGKNDGGGTPKFAFTRAAGRLWQIELK